MKTVDEKMDYFYLNSFMLGFKAHVTMFCLLVFLCYRVECIRSNCMKLTIFNHYNPPKWRFHTVQSNWDLSLLKISTGNNSWREERRNSIFKRVAFPSSPCLVSISACVCVRAPLSSPDSSFHFQKAAAATKCLETVWTLKEVCLLDGQALKGGLQDSKGLLGGAPAQSVFPCKR